MSHQGSRPEDTDWLPDVGHQKHHFGRSAVAPWLWLLVIGFLALIFWQFVPKTEVQVLYHPWFIEQVENDNIKSLSFQGVEIRGELRAVQPYVTPAGTSTPVRKFSTYAPSVDLIKPVVEKLQEHAAHDKKKGVEPAKIEGNPPSSASSVAWVMLLMPTFVILGF